MSILTFLFTDIEGSTRRWEADADEMRAALAIHDDVMREIVEAHQGRLFKHTGDGVCVAFDSPRSAIDAAVAAQHALDLPVRMGIATGEAELRGDDYFGSVLNRAARMMAAGHGGQVLLDGATAGLITGVPLADLGPRRLRDIALPVNVFQICADGLRSEFPPLRTLDSTPGNLRTPTTSFLGREAEIADLQRGVEGASTGDSDRTRWRRQDSPRAGGRITVGARLPRRGVDDRTGACRRSGRCPRSSGGSSGNHAKAGHEPGR